MKTLLLAGAALMLVTGPALAQTAPGTAGNTGTSAKPTDAQPGNAGRMGSSPTTGGAGTMGNPGTPGAGTRMSSDPTPAAKDGTGAPSQGSSGSGGAGR
jgi:hypothetical protein